MNNISNFFSNFKIQKIKILPKKFKNFLTRSPLKDIFESKTIDIHSKGKFPSNVLSNFQESKFQFEGIQIESMEGFLQSLKTTDNSIQKKVCKMKGKDAKEFGINLIGKFKMENLNWQGKNINRYSEDYQDLLRKVYRAKFEQDPLFRKALEATKGKDLTHSIGKHLKEETILTEEEFITILNWLRFSI